MSESVVSQSTDQSTDSGRRVTRTYGRTHGDELVQMRDPGCESNAREPQTDAADGEVGKAIRPIVWGRSPRFAEVNGAKVVVTRDLPESILTALASLVDAVTREFGDAEERRRLAEMNEPKPTCRWHPGEVAHNCRCCAADRKAAS